MPGHENLTRLDPSAESHSEPARAPQISCSRASELAAPETLTASQTKYEVKRGPGALDPDSVLMIEHCHSTPDSNGSKQHRRSLSSDQNNEPSVYLEKDTIYDEKTYSARTEPIQAVSTSNSTFFPGDLAPPLTQASLHHASGAASLRQPSLHHEPDLIEENFEYPEGGFRAYLVVIGAFSGMFAAFGFMNTIGTLQAYVSTHQLKEYNESAVGWIFSLYIFMAFFGGIQVGPAFDRWGPRGLVAAGGVLLITGEVALANSTTFAHFVISLSLLCGIGTTLIFTPCISAIAHWFYKRRATMTGLAATGGSIGGVLFPLVLPNLFESIGWTWAIRLMALVHFVASFISLFLLRARLPPKRGVTVRPDFTIFRNIAFAFTTGGVFAMEWGLFVPLTFFSSWAIDAGLGSSPHNVTFPFSLLAILNGASFFGRWLPGLAADRWGRFNTLAASMAGSLIFLIAVWLPAVLLPGGGGQVTGNEPTGEFNDTIRTALAVLFALGFGFFFGAGISLTPVCVGELCDPREYGRWYATCYCVVSFGCLTGVPIAGVVLGDGGTRGWANLVLWTSACYVFSLGCFIAARVTRGGWRVLAAV